MIIVLMTIIAVVTADEYVFPNGTDTKLNFFSCNPCRFIYYFNLKFYFFYFLLYTQKITLRYKTKEPKLKIHSILLSKKAKNIYLWHKQWRVFTNSNHPPGKAVDGSLFRDCLGDKLKTFWVPCMLRTPLSTQHQKKSTNRKTSSQE